MLDSLKTSNSRILSATTVDNNSWNARQKNKNASEGFKLLTLKVVSVNYDRWSLTRGSKYNDLTWKFLVRSVYQANPVGVQIFCYVNTFLFCSNNFARLLET